MTAKTGILENRKNVEVGEGIEGFQEETELSFEEVLSLTFLLGAEHTYEVDRWRGMGGNQARVMT